MGEVDVQCNLFANPCGYFEERLLGFYAVMYIPSDLERWIQSRVRLNTRRTMAKGHVQVVSFVGLAIKCSY